jgi:hypothetical protein
MFTGDRRDVPAMVEVVNLRLILNGRIRGNAQN